jgi:hypothetical protein
MGKKFDLLIIDIFDVLKFDLLTPTLTNESKVQNLLKLKRSFLSAPSHSLKVLQSSAIRFLCFFVWYWITDMDLTPCLCPELKLLSSAIVFFW